MLAAKSKRWNRELFQSPESHGHHCRVLVEVAEEFRRLHTESGHAASEEKQFQQSETVSGDAPTYAFIVP